MKGRQIKISTPSSVRKERKPVEAYPKTFPKKDKPDGR